MLRESGEESSKKRKVSEKTHNFKKSAPKEAIARYNQYFKNCDLALERGIDLKVASAEIKAIINHYQWKKLVKVRTEQVNHTLVAEFYATLSLFSTEEDVHTIELRKASIPFTPQAINAFFGIPDVPHDQLYNVVWELHDKTKSYEKSREAQVFINPCATWRDGRFRIGGATDDAKVIKHLTAYNILPCPKTSDLNRSESCMVYAILTRQPIDIGLIIFREAYRFAHMIQDKGTMPYPGLITDLCKQAKVPLFPTDVKCPPSCHKITSKTQPEGVSEPQAAPNISIGASSFSQQFPQPSQGSYFQDPALVARLDNMAAEMRDMRGNMQTFNENILHGMEMNRQMNENMFRGFEATRHWCDELRIAARSQRDLSLAIHNRHTINRDDFDTCQAEPYTMPTWSPLSPPPPPTHTTTQDFGGGTHSTFAGMASGSVHMSGLTAGFGGMSLDSSTVVSTQFGPPYTGSLQTLATIAAQAASPSYFDPSIFQASGVSLMPHMPFTTATLPPETSYHVPFPDPAFEGID